MSSFLVYVYSSFYDDDDDDDDDDDNDVDGDDCYYCVTKNNYSISQVVASKLITTYIRLRQMQHVKHRIMMQTINPRL